MFKPKKEKDGINLLLNDILMIADNEEPQTPQLNKARLLSALQGHQPFSIEEEKILLHSYLDREQFLLTAAVEQAKALEAWNNIDYSWEGVDLLAAADNENKIEPIHYKDPNDLYQVYFIPIDAEGKQWRIEVMITPEFKIMTPCGFKLVDKGGREWLSGQPNEAGELIGFWLSEEESLLERIKIHQLPVLKPL